MSASVPGHADRRQARRLAAAALSLLVIATGLAGPAASPAAAAAPLGQFLWWTDEGDGYRQFGPSSTVTIHTGAMAFVNSCPLGVNDFLFPWTDIYVVRKGTVGDGTGLLSQALASVKTVQGTGGGLFGDEIIAFTFPANQQLREGEFAVVYDECQDGYFNAATDALFDPAFRVEIGATTVPPLPLDLTVMKTQAFVQATHYAAMDVTMNVLALGTIASPSLWQTSIGIVTSIVGLFLDDPVAVLSTHLRNMVRHYLALAQDPPDPAFEQPTALINPMPGVEPRDDTSAHVAAAGLAAESGTEAALIEGFVHSLERYQGAAADSDGTWALAHARAMADTAALVDQQLDRTADALDALADEIDAIETDLSDAGDALVGLRDRLATDTLTADERLLFRSLGLESDLPGILDALVEMNLDDFDATTVAADLRAAADDSRANRSTWQAFEAAAAGISATLEEDPTVEDLIPVAVPGGPYTATTGVSVALAGGSVTAGDPVTSYSWDLDGDGAFDDATGPAPSVVFDAARSGVIGLRVGDDSGRAGIAYAPIVVTWSGAAPQIGTRSPAADPVELYVGASQSFSVGVSDPDGPPPTVEWFVDGASVGTGPSYQFDATAANVGTHVVEAAADDGSRRRLTSWAVGVRHPDADGDAWPANLDCDDANPAVNPSATEIPLNGIDDDCDPGTSDDGLGPTATFVSSAPAGGRNVALLDVGPTGSTPSAVSAVVVAESPAHASNWAMSAALDAEPEGPSWAAAPATLRYGVVRLWGNATWLIDRVAITPRIDYQPQRVRDFAVDVSTTGFANEADWTQVLTATAADSGDRQTFALPGGPVLAKYVRVRLLSNRGDPTYISVSEFKVYSTQQSAGSTFEFEDRSTDPEDDIVAREWDFGDGTSSTAPDPSHTFAAPGTYSVTLTVTDSRGHTDATSLVHRVLVPPTGAFTPSPNPLFERDSVFVTPTVADPDGERIVRIEWSWGDGTANTTSTNLSYNGHQYLQDGAYTIRLMVTDAQEQVTEVERSVTVANRPPNATLSDRTVLGGLPFTFSANPYDFADPITCEWDWGDGSPLTTGCDPKTHVYPSPGAGAPDATYTQTFRATDDDDTTTRTATITVSASLPARILPDARSFLFEAPALLTQVTGTTSCVWDFGDGSATLSGCGNQNHAYPAMSPGAPDATYTLSLRVTSGALTSVLAGEMTIKASAAPAIHATDFTGGAPAEWSGITTTEPVQGFAGFGFAGTFLHNTTNTPTQPTTLTLTGLPPHEAVSLGFLLAMVDSWDGTGCFAGPDRFNVRVDGALVFSEVFENSVCGVQSYVPPAGVELVRHRHLGFITGTYWSDSAYNMALEPRFQGIPHTAATLTIEFVATSVYGHEESFALDDVEVMLLGVAGAAPIADPGGPYTVNEGSTLTVDGSGSIDPDGGSLSYAWDLDDDGDFDDAVGTTASVTPDDGPATMTIHLRVTDEDGQSAEAGTTIGVLNADPAAVLDAPAGADEGATFTLSLGSAGDPSAADAAALEFGFDCGLGAGYGAFGPSSSTVCTAGDDDVDAAVRARVRDKDGGVAEYTATVDVLNVAPGGAFDATDVVPEGGAATLAWTGATDPSTPDAAALRFSFSCDASLATPTGSWALAGTGPSAECTYDDDGLVSVLGRVLDPDNASTTTGDLVTVVNVAPQATLSAPATAHEGGGFSLQLVNPSDPSPVDTAAGFRYAFDCGDGEGYGDWSTVPSVACPALPNDGPQAVAARIADQDGGVTPYAAVVTIVNVTPSVSLANDGPAVWGFPVELTATAVDPSPVDATGLTYAWDLDGDGVFEFGPSTDPNVAYAYPAPQQVDAAVRVCDDDACATATTQVAVTRRGTSLTDQTAASVQYGDPLIVRSVLEDVVVAGAVVGRTVTLSAGSDSSPATTDTAGVAAATFVVGLPAGASLAAQSAFAGDSRYGPSSASRSVAVTAEDAAVEYSGDTFATGTVARLAATVTEAADGSLGDITRASITFDVYVGATACGSGTPIRYGPIAVVDTGAPGDGVGVAEYAMATPSEQTYCIVARLTGAGQTSPNPYYAALPSQGAVLTVVSTTGKFATGGGWIADAESGGRGNLGFTARFTKNGSPKGQAVYVWRTVRAGEHVDVIVKSTSITSLSFADDQGTGTFPWRATMTGKATIRINRAATGTELWTDGNASFTLVAVDSGASSGIGVDTYALRVLDKNGSLYRLVGAWSGSTWAAGVVLSGGNVMVHLK